METPVKNNAWAQGHVDPWWDLQHRNLKYIHEQFNDTYILREWCRLGYTQARSAGDMYDMTQAEPDWIAPFRTIFPFERFSWSLYRMPPGRVLPAHRATYDQFKSVYGLETTHNVVRTIVFLEDWASGHYLEMNGQPFTDWRAGDWVSWRDDFLHLTANMGQTDRYTLQLTGTV
jgi:hypothetical protein